MRADLFEKTFSDLDFFGQSGWGFEPTLQKGQVGPQVKFIYVFGPVREIISVMSQTGVEKC